MTSSSLEVIYKSLEREHRQIMTAVEELQSLEAMTEVPKRLDRLRAMLIVHFSREQFPNGFYDTLGERAQSRRDEIQRLIEDHASILSTLNALIDDVGSAGPGAGEDLMARIQGLIEQVNEHEATEHRFAVSVLGAQTGG